MKNGLLTIVLFMLAGCSVFGEAGVNSAPYTLIKAGVDAETERPLEIRNYESMVLVSTSMDDDGRNTAFRRLFNYIAGANEKRNEIAMTAPVFMGDEVSQSRKDTIEEESGTGVEIAMTAPVFMGNNDAQASSNMMSFVMPADFTLASTPVPTDSKVIVSELKDYKVAAITFSWTLSDSNVEKHTQILQTWLTDNGYTAIGKPYTAAYNGPMTLPMYRKNEVLIPVSK